MYNDLRKPAKQADQRKEDCLQRDCAGWLKHELYLRDLPQVMYHPPNGGNRNLREAARLKLHGVLAGVSDIVLPLKSGEYCGVYCELKTKGDGPKPEQRRFLNDVAAEGYLAVVVNDFETFKNVFTYYLDQRQQ